jgi:hypothetical protein
MTESSSVDQASPELEALEAFLGDNPEELVAFTETPFGALLNRANELGFDGDLIQTELASTGVLDAEAWLGQVGLARDEFLTLTPLEYADRYPEHGAPLVAALLNSIHLSEEQASLHALAGGTNLSKGEKWEIGVGAAAAVVTGVYVVSRIYSNIKIRNRLLSFEKEAIAAAEKGNLASAGIINPYRDLVLDGGVLKLERDVLGIKHMSFTANSFKDRLIWEWNKSLFGLIHQIQHKDQPAPPDPNTDPSRRSEAYNELRASLPADTQDFDNEVSKALRKDLVREGRQSEVVNRNIEKIRVDPEGEFLDLTGDMRDAAGVRRPSMKVVINEKLDGFAVEGLEEEADTVLGSLDLHALEHDITNRASYMVETKLDAVKQELEGIKASVESNIEEDLQSVKSAVSIEIDEAVSKEEMALIYETGVVKKEVDQAIETDAEAFKASVDKEVENVLLDVDNGIDRL